MKSIIKYICSLFVVVTVSIGTLAANGAPGDLFVSVNGDFADGAGFISQYTPGGVQNTFASGLSQPRGLAFDRQGNLFVANNVFGTRRYHPSLLRITPDGTQTVFGTMPAGLFAEGVAIDRSDNVFVLATDTGFAFSTIYRFTPHGKRRAFGSLPGPSEAYGLAFDGMGNLFAADAVAQTIYLFGRDRTRSVFVGPEAFDSSGPMELAFDAFGNLFVSTDGDPGDDTVLAFTPSAIKSTFATGLTAPRGLAFDNTGNLFVAEGDLFTTGDILKLMPDGMQTVFASGIAGAEFLAFAPTQ
jgi:sugar lactone lactonase YvrE